MGRTINRAGVVAYFGSGAIDVNDLTPQTLAALDRAAQAAVAQGVADAFLRRVVTTPGGLIAELRRIAGADGRIALGRDGSSAEVGELFTFLEHFDRNGSGRTALLYHPAGSPLAKGLTPAGEVYQALRGERRSRDTATRDQFTSTYSSGRFELSELSPEARARLAELGVDMSKVNGLAEEAGRLHGRGALQRLFAMLEPLDERGRDGRLDRRKEVRECEIGEHTGAGEALALLEKVFKPFDRVQNQPLRDSSVVPRRLKVPFLAQTTPDGCFRANRSMVGKFERGLSNKVPDANGAFYMARGEDAAGRIWGIKGEFDKGRRIVDGTLDGGRPIIVGVSHSKTDVPNLDRLTDHFLVITGRGVDENDNVYYTFHDSATGDPKYQTSGRLFVDAPSGILYMPPNPNAPYPQNLGYQVTQVRPYTDTSLQALGFDAA